MAFKVQELLASLNKTGVAPASHFEVQINNPASNADKEMMFRADSAELPGRTMSTSEYRGTTGPIRKIAYASTYRDTTIGFLCSADLREKKYFEEWQDIIMNHKSTDSFSSDSLGDAFGVGYYDDYAKLQTVEIRQYDETKSKFSTFATLCIKNAFLNHRRKDPRRKTPKIIYDTNLLKSVDREQKLFDKDKIMELIPAYLTSNEKFILQLKLENHTNKEIAEELHCSKRVIDLKLRNITCLCWIYLC